jgi:hypothetical protein
MAGLGPANIDSICRVSRCTKCHNARVGARLHDFKAVISIVAAGRHRNNPQVSCLANPR